MNLVQGETPRTIVAGLAFPEGPRWHGSALWFSDIHAHRVMRVSWPESHSDERVDVVAELGDEEPSGLGWLPGGDALVVAMVSRRVLRIASDGTTSVHADLSGLARGILNDMIVADDGTAYVGDMGFDVHSRSPARDAGQLIAVRPDGSAALAADGLAAPNGMILDPGDRTLIVAESAGGRLTAFDRAPAGELGGRRSYAPLAPGSPDVPLATPDGICLDAEGAVWVADPMGKRVIRVRAGGEVTDSISTAPHYPVACVLGGADRRTLLVCAAPEWQRDAVLAAGRQGHIDAITVQVPGHGKP